MSIEVDMDNTIIEVPEELNNKTYEYAIKLVKVLRMQKILLKILKNRICSKLFKKAKKFRIHSKIFDKIKIK